jgi:hypothetical protein
MLGKRLYTVDWHYSCLNSGRSDIRGKPRDMHIGLFALLRRLCDCIEMTLAECLLGVVRPERILITIKIDQISQSQYFFDMLLS